MMAACRASRDRIRGRSAQAGAPTPGEHVVRRFRLLSLLLAGVLILAAEPLFAQSGNRLHGVVYLGDLPTLVAEERGYFEQAGLNLAVTFGRSGLENLELLRAGETDFALMALTPLVLDRINADRLQQANDPVILAGISHSIGLDHVMARSDTGIERPQDLAGRRIGVMHRTNAELLLSFFLTYHGVSTEDAELVDMPVDEVVQAISSGELDAGVLWEPWASRVEQDSGLPFQRFAVSNVYTARWVLVARRAVVEESPQYCRDLLAAYMNAIAFMDRNPEKAISIYAEHSGLAEEMVRGQWSGLIYGLSLNWSLLTGLEQEANWAREAGYALSSQHLYPLSFIIPGPLHSLLPGRVSLPGVFTEKNPGEEP